MTRSLFLSFVICIWMISGSSAQEILPTPVNPPETVSELHSATEQNHCRAGYPLQISRWARLTYGPDYLGYLVGGGKVPTEYPRRIQAEAPYYHEGTWGMDYSPWWTKVDLLWSHGQLYQGGTGQYEPDRKNFPFDQRFGRRIRTEE